MEQLRKKRAIIDRAALQEAAGPESRTGLRENLKFLDLPELWVLVLVITLKVDFSAAVAKAARRP